VIVAERLTVGRLLGMDRKLVRGLVLGEGAETSHTVILARSMGIATVVGVRDTGGELKSGQDVIVDGDLGLVIPRPGQEVRKYYARQIQTSLRAKKRWVNVGNAPIEVGANISSAGEVRLAIKNGAEGIGLFRTEMLFLDRNSPPTEDDQAAIYSEAAKAAGGKTIIIRLLDVGGDKAAEYLKLPHETNPFLGYRGVRIYEQFHELIGAQLRAILRASGAGNVKIMVPMVCCVEEMAAVREMAEKARRELADRGIAVDRMPQIGAMIEVPSAAFMMAELAKYADFFSIGSNDLTQYFLAADRGNERVASIYSCKHPAFLRLLKTIVDGAHAAGRWVGLCGEMDDAALPLLVGMGLDEISVSVARLREVRGAMGGLDVSACGKLLEDALRCERRAEVDKLLAAAQTRQAPAIYSEDLVLRGMGETKEQVIRETCDCLYVAGRGGRPQLIEEAIWRREDAYSTGFGGGFAIPHCRSPHVLADSIVICRLDKPVAWGSADDRPVDVVILLAIREGQGEHLKILSRLSRLVMREEFREQIRRAQTPGDLVKLLWDNLEEPI